MTEIPALFVFPTRYRDKHAKIVSFPIGAEVISRALVDVPQAKLISCSFTAGGHPHQHALCLQDKFRVFSATFSRRDKHFNDAAGALERGVLDAKWNVIVYAVPVAHRHDVKILVLDALVNTVRPWFVENASNAAATGELHLGLTYDTQDKRLHVGLGSKLDPLRN